MGADKSAKYTINTKCPSPIVWDFDEKRLKVCSLCLGTKNWNVECRNLQEQLLEKPRIQNWTYFCPLRKRRKSVACMSKRKERRIK